jgi:hypothetical protein
MWLEVRDCPEHSREPGLIESLSYYQLFKKKSVA